MVRILLVLIIPLLLIFTPPVIQVIVTIKGLRSKKRLDAATHFIIAVCLEGIFTAVAFFISMYGLTYGIEGNNCAIGSFVFIYLGILITCTVLPLICLAGLATQYFQRRNTQSS